MSEHTIVYEGTPVAKPRMTQRDKWARRPAVLRYREYCDALRQSWTATSSAPSQVQMEFTFAPPKSWSRAKAEAMIGQPHTQKPDIDNLIKGVMDALWQDDSVIWTVEARKTWARFAGVVIHVTEAG